MNLKPTMFLLLGILLLATACNSPMFQGATSTVDESAIRTSVAETILAGVEATAGEQSATPQPEGPPTGTAVPTVTSTLQPSPTFSITPSPTDATPRVSVSVDTNCRTGPGVVYDLIGALLVGESAEIVARGESSNYWVIENPDRAGTCWLWGEYATTTGDTDSLPVMTPPPTPTPSPTMTPAVAFTIQYENYHDCGGTIYLSFYTGNTGTSPLASVGATVIQLTGQVTLYDSTMDVPFVGTANGCPPDLDTLGPGAVAYIAVPVGPAPAPPPLPGDHKATFQICSEDGLGGTCVTKELNFTIP